MFAAWDGHARRRQGQAAVMASWFDRFEINRPGSRATHENPCPVLPRGSRFLKSETHSSRAPNRAFCSRATHENPCPVLPRGSRFLKSETHSSRAPNRAFCSRATHENPCPVLPRGSQFLKSETRSSRAPNRAFCSRATHENPCPVLPRGSRFLKSETRSSRAPNRAFCSSPGIVSLVLGGDSPQAGDGSQRRRRLSTASNETPGSDCTNRYGNLR